MTTNLESGIRFSEGSRLKVLKPVLNNWIRMVEQYSRAYEDACWWYTERTSVGILASAAWQTKGWLALEEYQTVKHGEKRRTKMGRCDLYIADRRDNSFAVEAKQAWQTIRSTDMSVVNSKISDAWSDAGKLDKDEAAMRVAACFVVATVPIKMAEGNFDAQLAEWIERVLGKVTWGAAAWVFPKDSRALKNDKGRGLPGVLLILQGRQRGNKRSTI